jgi:hypothetical protein
MKQRININRYTPLVFLMDYWLAIIILSIGAGLFLAFGMFALAPIAFASFFILGLCNLNRAYSKGYGEFILLTMLILGIASITSMIAYATEEYTMLIAVSIIGIAMHSWLRLEMSPHLMHKPRAIIKRTKNNIVSVLCATVNKIILTAERAVTAALHYTVTSVMYLPNKLRGLAVNIRQKEHNLRQGD